MIVIEPFEAAHIAQAAALWRANYRAVSAAIPGAPRCWRDDSPALTEALAARAGSPDAVVARAEGELVGYMLGVRSTFHAEPTAYCPVFGHAAREDFAEQVIPLLYQRLAAHWVAGGCLNHLVTFFAADGALQRALYELGFGLMVVDALRPIAPPLAERPAPDGLRIARAGVEQLAEVMAMGDESGEYYPQSPLFLMREPHDADYYRGLLADPALAAFVAYWEGRPVGLLNARIPDEDDLFTLADRRTGMLDPLGAYIQADYRGRGIGAQLVRRALAWCAEQGLERVHVDYESANLFARAFWPRYFTPYLYSVKRRVNQDAAGNQSASR